LQAVTLNVENTDALEIVVRTEKLFSSVYESINFRFSLSDELDLRQNFAQRMEKYREENPKNAAVLNERIVNYEKRLRELGVAPEHLSVSNYTTWFVFRHFLLRLGVIFVLLPLVVIGATIHLPAYLLCLIAARIFRRHGPDESGGTIKIVAAIFLMPLTWLIVTAIVFFWLNWQAALIAFPLVIVCGYAALRCLEELVDLSGWFAAIWVLLRRRSLFIRLLFERRALQREIALLVQK
jgi:lysylphosphatidylglycerol synthetase-like protein (DUF2156 family)